MTISAIDLFGRSILTSKEQKSLKAANRVAKSIYGKRNDSPYKENFPDHVSLEMIEKMVIDQISLYALIASSNFENKINDEKH